MTWEDGRMAVFEEEPGRSKTFYLWSGPHGLSYPLEFGTKKVID